MTAQEWTENNGGWWGAVRTGCDWLKEHTVTAAALPPPGSRLKINTPLKLFQIALSADLDRKPPREMCHVTWGERCSALSIRLAAAAARGPSDSVAPQRLNSGGVLVPDPPLPASPSIGLEAWPFTFANSKPLPTFLFWWPSNRGKKRKDGT